MIYSIAIIITFSMVTVKATLTLQGCIFSVPCWSQDDIGGHLRKEGDDGPPEIKGSVLSSHMSGLIVFWRNLHLGVIIEPEVKAR